MAAEQELLDKIIAYPEDDEPRRQYAQILKGRGDPRGEFILLQLRIGAIHRQQGSPGEMASLTPRERALLEQHKKEWEKDLQGIALRSDFGRGFIQGLRGDATVYLAHAAELHARVPIVFLDLTHSSAVLEQVVKLPQLKNVVALCLFDNQIGNAGAAILANAPNLSNLKWLDVRENGIGMPGLEALMASPTLAGLRWFNFARNLVEDPRDTPIEDQGAIIDWSASEVGYVLESRFGPKPCLHWNSRDWYPPRPDAFIGRP